MVKSKQPLKTSKKVTTKKRKRFEELNIPVLVIVMLGIVIAFGVTLAETSYQRRLLGISFFIMGLAFSVMAVKTWYAKK